MKKKEQSDLQCPARRDEGMEDISYLDYLLIALVILALAGLLLFAWRGAPVI